MNENPLFRRIRSFVRRDSRMTLAQREALTRCWPIFGLEQAAGWINLPMLFGREGVSVLEIGFGSGQSLLTMAKSHPEQNFIGIETHKPGVGALLLGMELHQLTNIRVFYADAIEVLETCIPKETFDVIQIFFPDPWPKRKHHKRRLIQVPFVELLVPKLKKGGLLHLATDWQPYADHMMTVLSHAPQLKNVAGVLQYADRSSQRPIVTKFEERGLRVGRMIRELQFERVV